MLDIETGVTQPTVLGIDPGSKMEGYTSKQLTVPSSISSLMPVMVKPSRGLWKAELTPDGLDVTVIHPVDHHGSIIESVKTGYRLPR